MKKIAIVVLNWQGWQDTLVCLNSLISLDFSQSFTIIVCDNASTNESIERITDWAYQHYQSNEINLLPILTSSTSIQSGSFTLLQTSTNLGFAGGHNVAIRYALASQQYDYLWLLNNDTIVESDALSTLYHYAQSHPQLALVGSTIIENDQRDTVQCAGGCRYFPLLTIFKNVLGGKPVDVVLQHSENIKFDYIYGASLFLRVTAIEQVGLLNEDYFLFYEELDYCQRLKQQGFGIGWCPASRIYHKGSASVGSVREGNKIKLVRANYYENLSTLKYTARFHRRWLLVIMILRFTLKSLALIWRRQFFLLPPLFKAYWDFISPFFQKWTLMRPK